MDLRFNSTPALGVGMVVPIGGTDVQFGVRWKHISNGGTKGDNKGENYFLFLVGLRF